jgi:glycosyltransferase involved in cell wall biosynthesis
MYDISIILCCYNGKSRLRPTVEHIARQKVSKLSMEFIFVDNASTDGSAEYVQSVWDELKPKFDLCIVCEKEPGLIYARKAGVRAAKGKYIVFCDDDNWLREDYVQTAYNIMEKMPNVGVLGGQGVLIPGITPPEWWNRHQGNYAVGKQLPQSGAANERGFLYGAGMTTRTDLAQKVFDDRYPFLLTGRKGDVCLSGEDGEYCTRVRMMGYDLYYSEGLFYWHDIEHSRITKEYLKKLLESFDAGTVINEKYAYVIKFLNSRWVNRVKWLIIRIWNFVTAKDFNRKRKKQLLYFHLYTCGLIPKSDYEFDAIIGFMRYAKSLNNE